MAKNTWILVNRETGKPIGEFFSLAIIGQVNQAKYEVLTAHDWLVRFNRQAKTA